MKKIIRFLILVVMTSLLVACDNDEKSFKAMDRNNIPNKVTENFHLEHGNYGKFEWSSNNLEVINIVNNEAIVHQQEADILVTLTAKINNKKADFAILVLKLGSGKSAYERAKMIIENFKEEIIIDNNGKLLPKIIDGVYLKYALYRAIDEERYQIEERDDGLFVTSFVVKNATYQKSFNMFFYEDESMSELLYTYGITLKFI